MSTLKNQRGSVNTVEILLWLVIIMAITFGAIDYWVVLEQYNSASHLKNQYLDTARLKGCLEDDDINTLTSRLQDEGFRGIEIEVVDASNVDGSNQPIKYDKDNRAIRTIGEDVNSLPEIRLTIKANFERERFWISNMLGNKATDEGVKPEFDIVLTGTTYTEYVERS